MPSYLITGDDERLVSAKLSELIDDLIGGGDRSAMLESHDLAEAQADDRDARVRAAVNGAETQSLFADSRVVVVRNAHVTPLDASLLIAYLAAPSPSTHLVVTATGRLPKALADALKKNGATTYETSAPQRRKELVDWYKAHFTEAGMKIDAVALEEVIHWLGQDSARLPGLVEVLRSTYGDKHRLGLDDVEPFLGQAGSVQPWDLTDAVDSGDAPRSLSMLRRMVRSGEYHPFQILSILHNHYAKLLRLDGSGASAIPDVMSVISSRSEFQARKYLELARRIGARRTVEAIGLLARADRDLRGGKGLDEEIVLEILLARLSRLGGSGSTRTKSRTTSRR